MNFPDKSAAFNLPNEERSSFEVFDRRAKAGERLNVVFFGGSLTWGANASDPQLTSYRGLMSSRLEEKYPDAHFKFWDAAIGGTNSQLAAFRFERDVLPRNPDLVLLDFSLNDGLTTIDDERLKSYEALVRRIISEGNCPLVCVFLTDKEVSRKADLPLPRVEAHRELAHAYGAGIGDAVTLMRERAKTDESLLEQWWSNPVDKTHPGDRGYAAYFEAVWAGFEAAILEKKVCQVPAEMIYRDTYMKVHRQHLSQTELPAGWSIGRPNRISSWYDALMSRWLDDEIIANSDAKPLTIKFRGESALLFGESTTISGKYRVLIDGKPSSLSDLPDGVFQANSGGANGNVHHVRPVAIELDAESEHTLELIPLLESNQELRLESLCIAGRNAQIV